MSEVLAFIDKLVDRLTGVRKISFLHMIQTNEGKKVFHSLKAEIPFLKMIRKEFKALVHLSEEILHVVEGL